MKLMLLWIIDIFVLYVNGFILNDLIDDKYKINNRIYSSYNNEINEDDSYPTKDLSKVNNIFMNPVLKISDFNINNIKKCEFVGGFVDKTLPQLNLPEIAFIGRSNVGKSSMLNCLIGGNQKHALVSKLPGRTRRINLYKLFDKSNSFAIFADLPGYGYAVISKEEKKTIGKFLSNYFVIRQEIKLAVVLVDIRRDPQISDNELIEFLRSYKIPFVVCATKVDLLSKTAIQLSIDQLKNTHQIPNILLFSSVNLIGKNELWNAIKSAIFI